MAQLGKIYEDLPETPSTKDPSLHRIVIAGGGAAGLELATRLGNKLGKRKKASVTLIDKSRIHVWKPLLHEVASGAFDPEAEAVEILPHARANHYRYRIGAMEGINRERRQVYIQGTKDEEGNVVIPPRVIGYDTLVIAVGSLGNDFGIPGVTKHAIMLDSADEASRFNRRMINACLRANAQYEPIRPGQLHCAIIGAGATGVELAAELHKAMHDLASYGLDRIDFDKFIRITLIEAGPRILPALPEHISETTAKILASLHVAIRTSTRVVEVRENGVLLDGGEFLPAEMIVWAAGIKAPAFLAELDGLEVDRFNRLIVRNTLQTTKDDDIYAIGDCASYTPPGANAALPPRAQVAHQQATLAAKSIIAKLKGEKLPVFKYRDFGSLVSLSEYRTLGYLLGRFSLEGLFARLMYKSLYKMHQIAVLGYLRAALATISATVSRQTEPRIKLH